MKKYGHKRVAVVFSGGSAYGYAHIGILKGLEEMGLTPSTIVGTSMGAMVGALYAFHPDSGWVLNMLKPYTEKWYWKILEISNPKTGLMKGHNIEEEMRKGISDAKFSDLRIRLMVHATNLMDGKDVLFTKGNVADAVRASISVPIILQPVIKGGQILVDGGLTDNIYFDPLIPRAKDYDLVVIVHFRRKLVPLGKSPRLTDIVRRVYEIVMTSQARGHFSYLALDKSPAAMEFKRKAVVIVPELSDMLPTDFPKIDTFAHRGYIALRKARPKIRRIIGAS